MKGFVCLVIAIAIAVGAPTPVWAQSSGSVTYETRGQRAKTVFESLSKIVGQNWLIAPAFENEPLVVRLQGAKPDDVKKRLAFVFDGEWIEEKSGIRLIPIKRAPVDTFSQRIEEIKKKQAKAKEQLAGRQDFTKEKANALIVKIEDHLRRMKEKSGGEYDYDAEGPKVAKDGPFASFGFEIVTLMDPVELAKVRSSNCTVWSTRPTSKQMPLPQSVWPAIERFRREYAVWREAVGNRQFQMDPRRGMPTELYQLLSRNLEWSEPDQGDDGEIVKVLVVGTAWDETISQLEVKLVDKRGRFIATCHVPLYNLGSEPGKDPSEPAKKSEGPILTLDGLGLEFAKATSFDSGPGESNRPPISEGLRNYLSSPDVNEPLALVAGQLLVKYADAGKLQLLVRPMEGSMYVWGAEQTGRIAASEALRFFRHKSVGYRLDEADGWFVCGPDPQASSQASNQFGTRIDRQKLGKLIRSTQKAGYMTFEDAADYVAATGHVDDDEGPVWAVANFLDILDIDSSLITGDGRKLMRFFGALTPIQRRVAADGAVLTYGSLNPGQRQLIDEIVFGREKWRIQFSPPANNPQVQIDYATIHNGVLGEPTERFANGIDPRARIQLTLKNDLVIRAGGSSTEGRFISEMSPTQFGNQMFYRGLPENAQQMREEFSTFQVLRRREMKLKVDLDPIASLHLEAHELQGKSPIVDSVDKLPSDIRDQIENGRKQAENAHSRRPPPAHKG